MDKSTDSATTTPPSSSTSSASSSAVVGGATSTSQPTSLTSDGVGNQCDGVSSAMTSFLMPSSSAKASYRPPVSNSSTTNIGCGPSPSSMPSTARKLSTQEAENTVGARNDVTSATTATNNASIAATYSAMNSSSSASASASVSTTPTTTSNSNGTSSTSAIAAAMTRHGAFILPSTRSMPVSGPLAATTLQHTSSPHALQLPHINLNINTTTGGNFGVTVDPQISVENLKKIIAKKLKVAKDRICLLHRE
ncbi:PREDICTED: putative protein TPRXL, partial [Rhagoletis zephyria]|uniref:putative protein TPRXL n=1 Tax=Rhagoletis zephyria TaxID=28612 RepID=UPI0008115D7C